MDLVPRDRYSIPLGNIIEFSTIEQVCLNNARNNA